MFPAWDGSRERRPMRSASRCSGDVRICEAGTDVASSSARDERWIRLWFDCVASSSCRNVPESDQIRKNDGLTYRQTNAQNLPNLVALPSIIRHFLYGDRNRLRTNDGRNRRRSSRGRRHRPRRCSRNRTLRHGNRRRRRSRSSHQSV
jgi:hypothetical protein